MGRERTYIMIKPDGVQRGLIGNIIARFEAKGFQLKGLKMTILDLKWLILLGWGRQKCHFGQK